jgi:hypothetical protein
MTKLFEIIRKKEFLIKQDLFWKFSVFENITSTLNVTMSFSSDSVHNEYYELIKRLYSIMKKNILTSQIFQQFNDVLQRFSFFFEWKRIQSSTIHMNSWSMSECVKISIIISMMLRCWLKIHHIRKFYQNELLREFSLKNRRDVFIFVNIIISCFAKLTKNNNFISSFQLFVKNRKIFHEQILRIRHILKLMNADNKFFKNKSNTRDISDTNFVISCNDIDDTSNIRLFNAKKNEIRNYLNTFSNFHIKLNFEKMMKKYDVLWNINVLFDKDKHKFFKQIVLITNNRKSKRQFLFKNVVRFIIKVVINKIFIHTQSEIIFQMLRLQNQCLNLLKDLNYHTCNELNDDLFMNEFFSIHIKFYVRDRLKNAYVKRLNLSIKVSKMLNMNYEHLMQNAMNVDNLQIINWDNRSLYWYEECFFTFQVTYNRSSY